MLSQKGIILNYYFLFWDKVWATKPKTSGNETEGIGNNDLGYISQIFLPKTMGNDTVPCGFVYVIAPYIWDSINQSNHCILSENKIYSL